MHGVFRAGISDEEEDMDVYEDEMMELGSVVRQQRQMWSPARNAPSQSYAVMQNCMPDMAANAYMGRASKSTAGFAAKKMAKRNA